ncbi:DUF4258 domain-containing protein [Sphingomonas sp. LB-2]|uniref:DUF4258 domain-containing protein n=1 Tax=Sphingomonas caeni TaxID=2984949 RepID=UPI00222E06AB|nr:DUF4258 domain-containing protein [Sphingomonas caeni]MCW3846557.1 DUF4258 domain-containing protein [Sphingomonas caeni]
MANPDSGKVVVQFRPLPSQLLAMVQSAAAESRNVSFGSHALDRMEERGITTLDALRVLRSGEIKGGIEAGQNAGEWKCKIIKQIKGTREVGVITIVMKTGRLFVKTVEWEDI